MTPVRPGIKDNTPLSAEGAAETAAAEAGIVYIRGMPSISPPCSKTSVDAPAAPPPNVLLSADVLPNSSPVFSITFPTLP